MSPDELKIKDELDRALRHSWSDPDGNGRGLEVEIDGGLVRVVDINFDMQFGTSEGPFGTFLRLALENLLAALPTPKDRETLASNSRAVHRLQVEE